MTLRYFILHDHRIECVERGVAVVLQFVVGKIRHTGSDRGDVYCRRFFPVGRSSRPPAFDATNMSCACSAKRASTAYVHVWTWDHQPSQPTHWRQAVPMPRPNSRSPTPVRVMDPCDAFREASLRELTFYSRVPVTTRDVHPPNDTSCPWSSTLPIVSNIR